MAGGFVLAISGFFALLLLIILAVFFGVFFLILFAILSVFGLVFYILNLLFGRKYFKIKRIKNIKMVKSK